uniref:Uncharacterized protein n=1 Tax=Auxenochlorella protothecoides TaxID=3075 RepID=A0A1D1ZTN3_AUXPR
MEGKGASHGIRQYYVAVGTLDAKLPTLIDLLRALLPSAPLSLSVACGSRDPLDAVCAACLSVQNVRLHCLHSNLSEAEALAVVWRFKACSGRTRDPAAAAPHPPSAQARDQGGGDERAPPPLEPPSIDILATTDAALRLVPREAAPCGASLLINYDLPAPHPQRGYATRVGHLLGGAAHHPRIVVSFAAAGAAAEFRTYAGERDRPIEVMPIRVAEIFEQEPARG